MDKEENKLLKWLLPVLLGLLLTLVGVIYGSQKVVDAQQTMDISNLQTKQVLTDSRLQNLQSNVYLLCLSSNKKLNCIPPIN